MRLAREAAVRVVEKRFAMPLRAAGFDANVAVRIVDQPDRLFSSLDRPCRIELVLKQEAARRGRAPKGETG